MSQFVARLFRARRKASWAGYIAPALISIFFGLWGFEDGGLAAVWPYAAIVAVCIVQLFYRTVIGWILVLLPCVSYTLAVAINPQNGPVSEYVAFLLFGLIPCVLLMVGHPFRDRARRS